MFRVREALRDGKDPHDAVRHSIVRVGESITASAGTVILALLTLLLATFGLYKDLAVPLAVGVAIMLLIGLTLLPALLAILGRRAFWPSKIEPGTQREGAWAQGREPARPASEDNADRRPRACSWRSPPARSATSRVASAATRTPPAGSDAAVGNAALSKHFPQTSSNPANLVLAYSSSVWQDPSSNRRRRRASLRSSRQASPSSQARSIRTAPR